MRDAYALQRYDFRVTHLDSALGNDNFRNKADPLLIFRFAQTRYVAKTYCPDPAKVLKRFQR